MQIARLGSPWKLLSARDDFQTALDLRETSGATPNSVGEAMVAKGLSLVFLLRQAEGISLMKEGVELMRSNRSASGQAFLARGLRHLERGARFARRLGIAEDARTERMSIAKRIEALDQMRDP